MFSAAGKPHHLISASSPASAQRTGVPSPTYRAHGARGNSLFREPWRTRSRSSTAASRPASTWAAACVVVDLRRRRQRRLGGPGGRQRPPDADQPGRLVKLLLGGRSCRERRSDPGAERGRRVPRIALEQLHARLDEGLLLQRPRAQPLSFLNCTGGERAVASRSSATPRRVSGLDFDDDARGLAFFDWDMDGDLDVANQQPDGPARATDAQPGSPRRAVGERSPRGQRRDHQPRRHRRPGCVWRRTAVR